MGVGVGFGCRVWGEGTNRRRDNIEERLRQRIVRHLRLRLAFGVRGWVYVAVGVQRGYYTKTGSGIRGATVMLAVATSTPPKVKPTVPEDGITDTCGCVGVRVESLVVGVESKGVFRLRILVVALEGDHGTLCVHEP